MGVATEVGVEEKNAGFVVVPGIMLAEMAAIGLRKICVAIAMAEVSIINII